MLRSDCPARLLLQIECKSVVPDAVGGRQYGRSASPPPRSGPATVAGRLAAVRLTARLPALLAVSLTVAACGASAAASPSATGAVARVGTSLITQEQLDVRLQSSLAAIAQGGGPTADPKMLTGVTATVIGSLIFDTVVAQEAALLHVAATQAEVTAQLAQYTSQAGGATQLQEQLAAGGLSLAGLRDEISSDLNEQHVEDHFAEQRAAEVLQQLAQGADFASLVSQFSDSPDTSGSGGKLGTLTAAQVTSQLGAGVLAAVQPLSAGQHTKAAVHTSSGYEILHVDGVSAAGWTLREILVAAPAPYTVRERPQWFAEEVYYQIYQDCQQHQITVYSKVPGANPCTSGAPAGSPAASPSAASPTVSAGGSPSAASPSASAAASASDGATPSPSPSPSASTSAGAQP